jgi:glutaryl-CoA dehydrogenase
MSGAGSPRAAVADAEAIYSFEGTREISSLIVGRALTGIPAFV